MVKRRKDSVMFGLNWVLRNLSPLLRLESRMMNFDEIRKRNAAALEQYKGQPVKIQQKPPTYLSRVKHLIAHHLGEMTEWEANFCYSQIHYLTTWIRDRAGEQADDAI